MFINFEKWHACQNDFIVIWHSDQAGEIVLDAIKRQASLWCHRRAGIGADGILVLSSKTSGDLNPDRLTIINSDGSIAKNCGNGLRVAALSILKAKKDHLGDVGQKMAKRGDTELFPEMISLEVCGRMMDCRFLFEGSGGFHLPMVSVDMGIARFNKENAWHSEVLSALKEISQSLDAPWLLKDAGTVDLGNPHLVVIAEEANRDVMLKVGEAIQSRLKTLDGINVHITKPITITKKDHDLAHKHLGKAIGDAYSAYVWERGAGETMACGSGACAIVGYVGQSGLQDASSWSSVDMPGGRLYVKFEESGEPITLAGAAQFVFSGRISL